MSNMAIFALVQATTQEHAPHLVIFTLEPSVSCNLEQLIILSSCFLTLVFLENTGQFSVACS